jgi:L-malate glycosyltransferase
LRVLVLVPSLQEKGPNIVAKNLSIYSKNKEIEYIFCSLRKNSKDLLDEYASQNIRVIEAGMNKLPLPKDILSLKKLVKKIEPDVIHAHTFWPTVLAGIFLKSYKKVVTVHNNPIEDYTYEYGYIIGWLMTIIFNLALNLYDVIVPISNYVKSNIKTFTRTRVKVIYNGVEDRYRQFDYANNDGNTLNLVTISVLNKRKNVSKILEILKLFKEHNNYKVNCKIIGEGKEMPKLQKFVKKHGLSDSVSFLGKVSREAVFEYIKESDALIFTSKSEGFGLVVVESFMMGKPVIVNDIPVMWEIVDNNSNGFILKSNIQFVEAIKSLYNLKFRKKLSLSARNKYLNNFTVDKMVYRYEKLYVELSELNVKK